MADLEYEISELGRRVQAIEDVLWPKGEHAGEVHPSLLEERNREALLNLLNGQGQRLANVELAVHQVSVRLDEEGK
jgi:hypothetical protein